MFSQIIEANEDLQTKINQVKNLRKENPMQDEIMKLREFAAQFGSDSYIGMFLNADTLDAFEENVTNDFPFDPLKDANGFAVKYHEAKSELERERNRYDVARGVADHLQQVNQKLEAEANDLDKAVHEGNELREKVWNLREAKLDDEAEISNLLDKIEGLQTTIYNLNIQIEDLQNPPQPIITVDDALNAVRQAYTNWY